MKYLPPNPAKNSSRLAPKHARRPTPKPAARRCIAKPAPSRGSKRRSSSAPRRSLYIDGSNLFGGMSELLAPGCYIDFASLLAVLERDLPLDAVHFYATYMRTDKPATPNLHLIAKAQVEFLNSARACPKVTFHKGYFSGSGKEKGIDMQLGLDLYIDGSRGRYDEAILMSGDADFYYAVEKTKELGVPIHMMAFASRYPFSMVKLATEKIVYDYGNYFRDQMLPVLRWKPYGIIITDITNQVQIRRIKST